jgi:hypothetical protein
MHVKMALITDRKLQQGLRRMARKGGTTCCSV